VKAPGSVPKGVLRCRIAYNQIFLKLKDIGRQRAAALRRESAKWAMDAEQAQAYGRLAGQLTAELKQALARRDTTRWGVGSLNVLLPGGHVLSIRDGQASAHPHLLASTPSLFHSIWRSCRRSGADRHLPRGKKRRVARCLVYQRLIPAARHAHRA